MILKKGSAFYSIFKLKCPKCQNGDLYQNSNPYNFKKLGKMHKKCNSCGQPYSLEPGFYFGASYVSYAFNVALLVAVIVGLNVLFEDVSLTMYFGTLFTALFFLAPIFYIGSRAVWINFFVKYDPDSDK
ncbi:MAG: hypothetical protein ACJATA_000398 [Sphingobacteriales bacterium]|jgi:uncharacterized protein (DUF983 family)